MTLLGARLDASGEKAWQMFDWNPRLLEEAILASAESLVLRVMVGTVGAWAA